MLDTVTYIKERYRMCRSQDSCYDCPFYDQSVELCSDWEGKHPEEAIEIVEKWSEEHPQKTLKDDFLERCPGAELNCANEPIVCAKSVYGAAVVNCDSYRSCSDCWNRPLSEGE